MSHDALQPSAPTPAPEPPTQAPAAPPPEPPAQAPAATDHNQSGFWTMLLGSMGVVYGDIGTSPLYALRARSTT